MVDSEHLGERGDCNFVQVSSVLLLGRPQRHGARFQIAQSLCMELDIEKFTKFVGTF